MPSPSDAPFSTPSSDLPTDWGLIAQQAAEKHLAACHDAQDADDEGERVDWPDTAAPFCGCLTCIVREVLWVAWPIMERSVASPLR